MRSQTIAQVCCTGILLTTTLLGASDEQEVAQYRDVRTQGQVIYQQSPSEEDRQTVIYSSPQYSYDSPVYAPQYNRTYVPRYRRNYGSPYQYQNPYQYQYPYDPNYADWQAYQMQMLPDQNLTDRVRRNISRDRYLASLLPQIQIYVSGGVVTLTGAVPNSSVREKLGVLAKQTNGVYTVDNQLLIVRPIRRPIYPSQVEPQQ